jgi:hypothetical protein
MNLSCPGGPKASLLGTTGNEAKARRLGESQIVALSRVAICSNVWSAINGYEGRCVRT